MERKEKIRIIKLALERLENGFNDFICNAVNVVYYYKTGKHLSFVELNYFMRKNFSDLCECAKKFCENKVPNDLIYGFNFNGGPWFRPYYLDGTKSFPLSSQREIRIAILKDYIQKLENGEI